MALLSHTVLYAFASQFNKNFFDYSAEWLTSSITSFGGSHSLVFSRKCGNTTISSFSLPCLLFNLMLTVVMSWSDLSYNHCDLDTASNVLFPRHNLKSSLPIDESEILENENLRIKYVQHRRLPMLWIFTKNFSIFCLMYRDHGHRSK